MSFRRVRILGIGGTQRPHSSSELSARWSLEAARGAGAEVRMLPARSLGLPFYGATDETEDAVAEYLAALRWADGLIIGSPGYHGTVSGLLKNALDHIEALRGDDRVYLDSMPVGLIACAFGDQAAASTLTTLRTVVHSLRGWPTPLGVTINSALCSFDPQSGAPADAEIGVRLQILGGQVVEFCRRQRREVSRSLTEDLVDIAW